MIVISWCVFMHVLGVSYLNILRFVMKSNISHWNPDIHTCKNCPNLAYDYFEDVQENCECQIVKQKRTHYMIDILSPW